MLNSWSCNLGHLQLLFKTPELAEMCQDGRAGLLVNLDTWQYWQAGANVVMQSPAYDEDYVIKLYLSMLLLFVAVLTVLR